MVFIKSPYIVIDLLFTTRLMFRFSKTVLILLIVCFAYISARHLRFTPSVWFTIFTAFSLPVLFVTYLVNKLKFWRKKALTLLYVCLIFSFCGFNYSFYLRENLPFKLENPNKEKVRTLKAKVLEVNKTNKKFSRALIKLKGEIRQDTSLKVEEKALLYFENDSLKPLEIGNIILFNTSIQRVSNYNNPGEFDAKWFWENKGVTLLMFTQSKDFEIIERPFSVQNSFQNARSFLNKQLEKVCDARTHAVASALILGEKSLLDRETRSQFNTAGAMHVLAVSGLHVGILLLILEFFFKSIPILRKRKTYLLFAILALWAYAFLTGLSPSVIRATLMFSFLAIGQFKGKSMIGLDIIAFSAFIMLLIKPIYLFDIGFQLSYAAMFSISLFYIPIASVFQSSFKPLQKLWEGLAVCFAAQIGTIPLTLYYFHQFPNYFIITNIGLIILTFACMAIGVIYLSTFYIPLLSTLIGSLVFGIFWLLLKFVQFIHALPFALAKGFVLNGPSVLALYLFLLLLFLSWKIRKLKLFYLSAIGLFTLISVLNIWRLNQQNESHFTILNHNSPVMILNHRGINYCFYDLLNQTNFDGTDYLTDSYSKYFGGDLSYIDLSKKNIHLKLENCALEINWDATYLGYNVILNEAEYFLPTEEFLYKKDVTNILTRTISYEKEKAPNETIDLAIEHFKVKITS